MAYESYILVCGGTACCSGGADKIVEAFANELEAAGLKEKVQVVTTGCLGFCEQGPIVKILPQGTFYVQVKAEDLKIIWTCLRSIGWFATYPTILSLHPAEEK